MEAATSPTCRGIGPFPWDYHHPSLQPKPTWTVLADAKQHCEDRCAHLQLECDRPSAAKRLCESTGRCASTLQSLLGKVQRCATTKTAYECSTPSGAFRQAKSRSIEQLAACPPALFCVLPNQRKPVAMSHSMRTRLRHVHLPKDPDRLVRGLRGLHFPELTDQPEHSIFPEPRLSPLPPIAPTALCFPASIESAHHRPCSTALRQPF